MIKLQAEINGEHCELQIQRGGQSVEAQVAGRTHNLELHNPAPGELVLRSGTQVYRCRVETVGKQRGAFRVSLRGRNYAVELIDPKRLRGQQSSRAHDHGSAQIVAPMPGKIVRLLVEVGAQVEADAGIVVVEAMKMQNEMRAPKAGVVTAVNAVEGATVNAGDVLAVIE